MTEGQARIPTKTHRGENFPVASRLVSARHRSAILGFYRFARAADDIADDPTMPGPEKLERLDELEATLFGEAEAPDAVPLRAILAERKLSARHPCDLLKAFRLDVEKRRYRDWADLMDYCAVSAAPVGRFVLDVHGEPQCSWPASDALCAALQVINHLQDCAKDHRALDRVYLPEETLREHGARVEDLAAPKATPGLRAAITDLARRTDALLETGRALPAHVENRRLRTEIVVIQRLAETLNRGLQRRDPLSERVHLGKPAMAFVAVRAALVGYFGGRKAARFSVHRAGAGS
ncbi:squalene synthase HpnC [Aureimonas leprariae]|uniref:Squalene synthase HpnC n=1 Tax=Plantimonas leprariae TaxID=2615207 RepID=A0A7V7TWW3_9HYPH|nr:squalene synthase HpnC [Aureimonas leprariae]KAB0680641.1 squalene synthase HpnC [Aureimonas leprariae]